MATGTPWVLQGAGALAGMEGAGAGAAAARASPGMGPGRSGGSMVQTGASFALWTHLAVPVVVFVLGASTTPSRASCISGKVGAVPSVLCAPAWL